VAAHLKTAYKYNYQIGPPFASTPVCFRLHIQHEHWVKPFNAALETLRKCSELQQILSGVR
jgi:hypothetical protein